MKKDLSKTLEVKVSQFVSLFSKKKKKNSRKEVVEVNKKPEEVKQQFVFRDDTYFEYEDFN